MTFRSRPLLDLAKGQECMAQIPGVCNRNSSTTVSAHRNGGGMGTKNSDWEIAWCCSSCHDVIDGRVAAGIGRQAREFHWEEAHERTLDAMFELGLIQVAGNAPRGTSAKPIPKILPRRPWPPEAA